MTHENRDTFFARLEPHLAPSSLLDIQLAYTLAKFGHRAQTRKELGEDGQPERYFEHPRRVTLILLDEVKIHEPELVVAALLHEFNSSSPRRPPASTCWRRGPTCGSPVGWR